MINTPGWYFVKKMLHLEEEEEKEEYEKMISFRNLNWPTKRRTALIPDEWRAAKQRLILKWKSRIPVLNTEKISRSQTSSGGRRGQRNILKKIHRALRKILARIWTIWGYIFHQKAYHKPR